MTITLERVRARIRQFVRDHIVDDDPDQVFDDQYNQLLHDASERPPLALQDLLQDVPGFEHILIHEGNTHDDTGRLIK